MCPPQTLVVDAFQAIGPGVPTILCKMDSWDGDTGTISAVGITDGELIEYSPTNTVEVVV